MIKYELVIKVKIYCGFSTKLTCSLLQEEKPQELSKLNTFKLRKTLHWGSLGIMFTIPLVMFIQFIFCLSSQGRTQRNLMKSETGNWERPIKCETWNPLSKKGPWNPLSKKGPWNPLSKKGPWTLFSKWNLKWTLNRVCKWEPEGET